MGGHAFSNLKTPRMSKELYLKAREQTIKALQRVFNHVVVPTEMPSKTDYGDIDFLVAGPFSTTSSTDFDYTHQVSLIKSVLNTPHGRVGVKTDRTMFFAIPAPDPECDFHIQIDIKVCEKVELFEWEKFQTVYASAAKMIGSMIKPLGLTIDPEGLHIRVDDMDKTNLAGSMVFLTREPKVLLKIVGLDYKFINAGFSENEELFEYLIEPWVFNPAHFAERLKSDNFVRHLAKQSAPFVNFVQEWIPQYYPDFSFHGREAEDINEWYMTNRIVLREKVLAMFPAAASKYYEKRHFYVKEIEEQRLRELLMKAIPLGVDGWNDNLPQPHIITLPPAEPLSPDLKPMEKPHTLSVGIEDLTLRGSLSRRDSDTVFDASSRSSSSSPATSIQSGGIAPPTTSPSDTPLLLEALPRSPPHNREHVPRPPPANMSIEAKLLCIARWTLFTPDGMPYLTHSPREKTFEMAWADSGAEDRVLVNWVQEMWWVIWMRQAKVNWVGMWKKRFEKEDRKAERVRLETEEMDKKEKEEVEKREKVMWRLLRVNEKMGFTPATY